MVFGKNLGDVGQQVGTVGGDDFEGVLFAFFFFVEVDDGGEGQVFLAAGGVAWRCLFGLVGMLDELGEGGLQLLLKAVTVVCLAVGWQLQDEGVENVLVVAKVGVGRQNGQAVAGK